MKRLISFLLILCLLLPRAFAAEISAYTDDGLIRVMLSSIGSPETCHLILHGTYSVENDAGFFFEDGTQIVLTAENDILYMGVGGMVLALGNSVTFTRHASAATGGIELWEISDNLYTGDLTVTAAENTMSFILAVPMEEYLAGVVAYEMSDSFPLEALKAQAVAARSYALYKKSVSGNKTYDVLDTTADQVYRGLDTSYENVLTAVQETEGICGFYNGKPAVTYFSASNGGETALPQDVWSNGKDLGYYDIRKDPYDLENPKSLVVGIDLYENYLWNSQEVQNLLKTAYGGDGEILSLTAVEPGDPLYEGTTRYGSLYVTCKVHTEKNIRVPVPHEPYPEWLTELLPDLGEVYETYRSSITTEETVRLDTYTDIKGTLGLSLNGSNYEMLSVTQTDMGWTIEMRRFGHGIGLSQRGAQQMAQAYDMTAEEILAFYYPGLSFEKVAWSYTPPELSEAQMTLMRTRGMFGDEEVRPQLNAGESYARVNVTGTPLNVRSGPGTTYDILTVLTNRTLIVVTEWREDGWCAIRLSDGTTGFVKNDYVVSCD